MSEEDFTGTNETQLGLKSAAGLSPRHHGELVTEVTETAPPLAEEAPEEVVLPEPAAFPSMHAVGEFEEEMPEEIEQPPVHESKATARKALFGKKKKP